MRQIFGKCTLVAVLAAAALMWHSQPASAQIFTGTPSLVVTPNGVGDLLVFGYWTSRERDTLMAVTTPYGGQNRFVHIRIREGINSDERANFTICLSPGDVWTAAITTSGGQGSSSSILVIGNPGSCDDNVAGSGFTPPPAPGDPPLGLNADFGYIEAYTMECRTRLASDPTPRVCTNPNGNNDGGDDAIMGTATLVSAGAGFASSYNSTSFVGFNAFSESASTTSSIGAGTVGGGGNRTAINRALAREGGVDKEILLGRWTASTILNSTTDIVLTFPGRAQPGTSDPVSIWVFNEEENFNFSPREITLNWEVNICSFQNADETASGNTQLSCNGDNVSLGGTGGNEITGPGGTFSGGWFRILNNNDLNRNDLMDGDGTGRESDDINAPPDSRFAVIGLVFSFFEAVNGIFDQAYPIQWAAIVGVGGIGGPDCVPFLNPAFPIGCNSFDIQSKFMPWFLNPADDGDFVAPGDSFFGGLGLARDGTTNEKDNLVDDDDD